ncbi:3-keto-5-aminohexanoate cleavage protein [Pseudomonas sp.]|uniref:3-keto-5-aminohexanoate cleavage protein n=1 Tax=Pseudomonas sp. TaxID=306 RepID=UPI003A96E341
MRTAIIGAGSLGTITCALTGAIHAPSMSDALPYTPDDIAAQASAFGGNVRVGLEDRRGTPAESNAQQVAKIRCIIEALRAEVATPDQARDLLGLKGGDKVNL